MVRIKILRKCDMGDIDDIVDVDNKGAKAMVDEGYAKYDFEITKEEAVRLNKSIQNKKQKRGRKKEKHVEYEEKPYEEIDKEEQKHELEYSGEILFKEPILNGNEPKWLIIKERTDIPNRDETKMIVNGEKTEWLHHRIFSVSNPNQWRCHKCKGSFTSEKKPVVCLCCERETHFEQLTDEIDTTLWKLPLWEDIPVENIDMINMFVDLKKILERTIVFPDKMQYDIFALWVISTWKHECWDSVSYLIFRGLIETGKSKALELLYEFGYRMMLCSSITFPAMQRATHFYTAGLLIDEIDTKIDQKTDNGKQYLDFLKPSYKRKSTYHCADLENQEKIRSYRSFGFKAFAGEKGGYDEAIFSRSIDFQMEQVYPEIDELRMVQQEINKIQTILLNYRYKIGNPPELPDDVVLKGRDREIFSCIIRTAVHIGIDYKEIVDFIVNRKKEKQEEVENSDEYAILKILRTKECNPTLDDAPESIAYSEIAEALGWDAQQRQKLGYIFKKKLNLRTKRLGTGSVLLLNDEKNINKLKGLYRRYNLGG